MNAYISIAIPQSPGWSGCWIVAVIGGGIAVVLLLAIMQLLRSWLPACMSKADVRMTDLIGIRLRIVNAPAMQYDIARRDCHRRLIWPLPGGNDNQASR